jgi:hypothetical protein
MEGMKFDEGKPESLWFYLQPYAKLMEGRIDNNHVNVHVAAGIESLITCLLLDNLDGAQGYLSCISDSIRSMVDINYFINKVNLVSKLGVAKYGYVNYQNGLKVSRLINAMCRHFLKHLNGLKDEESGEDHIWHVLANVFLLVPNLKNNDLPEIYAELRKKEDSSNAEVK